MFWRKPVLMNSQAVINSQKKPMVRLPLDLNAKETCTSTDVNKSVN